MLLRKPKGKLTAKWFSLDTSIFLSRFDTEIKPEEHDPCWNIMNDLRQKFYYKLSFFNSFASTFFKNYLIFRFAGCIGVLYEFCVV